MTVEEKTPGSGPAEPPRFQPAADVLSGETADVYFERTAAILKAEHLDPVVSMEIFGRADAILCGAEESLAYLREILGNGKRFDPEPIVEALHDGDPIGRKEVVMRITARYSAFGLYETALLGILAQSTGWATAARRIVDAAAPIPVIGFGARHVHPSVADQMDYASVVGGCIGASTPAGARLAGLAPTGTMPHALIHIFCDTVRAVEAFDRHVDPDVPRIALVDTFKDEAEESVRVANALGERLWGVRLDTPSERGRVTADLVKEVRARLDLAGHSHVRIVVSGGLDVERIAYFKDAGAPVDSFAVGSAISDASPIDFTGDLKEIDGRPIAKRGRIPGITPNPRLERVDLHA
jgi:nicotinate phosphoribosyltransferase